MVPISVRLDHADPPTGVVALSGEQDAYSAPRLENELCALLDEGIGVVVDLTETSFLDSQSLSTLLTARHRAERDSLGFTVVLPHEPHTQVHRMLDITGLTRAFAVYPAMAPALAAARAGHSGGHARAA
jgi:anti-anti-sigma factor